MYVDYYIASVRCQWTSTDFYLNQESLKVHTLPCTKQIFRNEDVSSPAQVWRQPFFMLLSLHFSYLVLRMKCRPESHVWGTLCCVSAWGVPGSKRDCSVKPSFSLLGKALALLRLGKSSQLLFAECLSQKRTQQLIILGTFFQRLLIFLHYSPCCALFGAGMGDLLNLNYSGNWGVKLLDW